tara:strand:+ start:38 stop:262 length:225 start_codon:yes stop_codon:yes gene_type:complete
MLVSTCCSAPFYEPGWPDNDICSECKEHAGALDDDDDSEPVEKYYPENHVNWGSLGTGFAQKDIKKGIQEDPEC